MEDFPNEILIQSVPTSVHLVQILHTDMNNGNVEVLSVNGTNLILAGASKCNPKSKQFNRISITCQMTEVKLVRIVTFIFTIIINIEHIAGNFRGVIFSWISWLVQNHNFLPTNKGCAYVISNNRLTNHKFFPTNMIDY